MTRSRNHGRLATWWATDRAQQPTSIDQAPTSTPINKHRTDTDELRYGYTMASIDRLAKLAVSRCRLVMVRSHSERYELAWSAIAEALYAAHERPDEQDLVSAGQRAIWDEINTCLRHDGYHLHRPEHGPGSSASFHAYWSWVTGDRSSYEDAVIDRLALRQIWPILTPRQRETIATLATTGRLDLAAERIGITNSNMTQTVKAGRDRFRLWWHEGETPSRHWCRDMRVRNGQPIESSLRRRMKYRRYHARKALVDAGVVQPTIRPEPLTDEDAKTIVSSYESGATLSEIVADTGISSWRVRAALSAANVTMRSRGKRPYRQTTGRRYQLKSSS
jgi:hypothetical protein